MMTRGNFIGIKRFILNYFQGQSKYLPNSTAHRIDNFIDCVPQLTKVKSKKWRIKNRRKTTSIDNGVDLQVFYILNYCSDIPKLEV